MGHRAKIVAGGLALGALAGAVPAAAATAAAAAPEAAAVEEVIVTAAKREQDVQDVPISMNVALQKQLEAFNMSDLKALSTTVPSMMVIKTNSVNTITLRGFGSSSANPAIDQTVALYMDGVYAGRARQYMANFFDVARVEVLRGPQGALLGKNTAAGAVSIVTNDPSETFGGEATGSYLFNRKGVDTYGYVTGPLAEGLSARVAVKYINEDGWVRNTINGEKVPQQDMFQARLGVKWKPSDNAQIVAKFQYDDLKVFGKAMSGKPGSFTLEQAMDPVKTESGDPDFDTQKGRHFSMVGTFGIGDLTLVTVTGAEYYHSDSSASASHLDPTNFTTRFKEKFQQYSQEVRLVSPTGGKFDWIVGAYIDTAKQSIDNLIRYKGTFIVFNLDGQMTSYFDQSADSYSVYGTGTWHFNDQARLIGGLRWSETKKDGAYQLVRDFGQNFIGSAPVGPLAGSLKDSHVDPSVTFQYDVTPAVMTYANYSEGSKGGTFQGANRSVTAATFELKPERSTNYEVGLKARAFDWLTFDAALYRLEFKNLQAGQYVNGVLLTKNAGAARSQGVEVVAAADLGKLRLDLTGAYTDAKYTDYPGAACTQAQLNAGCINGVTPVNAAGRSFAFVPKWTGRGTATYTTPLTDAIDMTLTAAAYYSSSYYVDSGTFNPKIGLQDGYVKIDLRAEVAAANGRWSVALVGLNVNDKITSSGVYPWPFAPAPVNVYTIDETASWALQGSVRF